MSDNLFLLLSTVSSGLWAIGAVLCIVVLNDNTSGVNKMPGWAKALAVLWLLSPIVVTAYFCSLN